MSLSLIKFPVPGGAGAARNGTSIESGFTVLGNALGLGVGGPAELTSAREISTAGFGVNFHDFGSDLVLQLRADAITLTDNNQVLDWFKVEQSDGIQLMVDFTAGISNKQFFTITDENNNYAGIIYQTVSGGNELQLYANGAASSSSIHIFDSGGVLIADGTNNTNGAMLQVAGSFTVSGANNASLGLFLTVDGVAQTITILGQTGYTGTITPGQTATVVNGIIVGVV